MPSYVNPNAVTNAFHRQLQVGQQQRASDQAEEMNALSIARQRRIEALGPEATAEQYIRAGDTQTGTALAGIEATRAEQLRGAFPKVGTIAAQVAQIQDPAQRRAAFKQAILQNGPLFDAMGMPHGEAITKLDASDDATLEATLAKLSTFAPKQAPIEVSAGASLARPDGKGGFEQVYTAPVAEKGTDDLREFERAQADGFKGTFLEYLTTVKRASAPQINPPSGYRWNPDGSLSKIAGGPADQPDKRTEGDKKASLLLQGMRDSESQLATIKGSDTSSKGNAAVANIPGLNVLTTEDYRKYRAAADRWAANYLYLKSGAQAGTAEINTTVAQFFPRPGDSPEVIAQKAAARAQEMAAVEQTYGGQQQPGAGAGQPPPKATASGATVSNW